MTKIDELEDTAPALDAADEGDEQPVHRTWRERGAGLVEYSLLLALIALVCISAITMLGGSTEDGPRGVSNSASRIINAGTP
jgi:Flp pilus assembly pilin Flp